MTSTQANGARRLWLIRHADTAHLIRAGHDVDRPLTARGEHDAGIMARTLASAPLQPDWIVSSNARRALATAHILRSQLVGDVSVPLVQDARLYEAAAHDVLEVIRETPLDRRALAVVGHNPAVSEVANALSSSRPVASLLPCSVVEFEVSDAWSHLGAGCATLIRVLSPRHGP
jgi:phosphohistidine phosphatase